MTTLMLLLAFIWPAPSVEGVPGWLALATVAPQDPENQVQHRYGFLPEHAVAEVVIVPSGEWPEVKLGARLDAVSEGGRMLATYSGSSSVAYGCDNAHQMATFDTAQRLVEGPVWLLQPGEAEGVTAIVPQEQPASDKARAWKVGALTFTVRKTGRMKGEWTLTRDKTVLMTAPFEKHLMEGAEDEPLDLKGEREIGVPFPMIAFERGSLRWLVLVSQAYEGVGLEVVIERDGKAAVADAGYLYWCAF